MKSSYIFFILSIILLVGCNSAISGREFMNWVHDEENGIHSVKAFDSFIFDLQYTPLEYRYITQEKPAVTFKEYTKEHSGIEYFTLTISLKDSLTDLMNFDVSDADERQRRVYYLSYGLQNDVHLEINGQQFPCVLFHFERSDLRTSGTFTLAFDRSTLAVQKEELMTFTVTSPLFATLPIKIKIKKTDLPSIAL